MFFAFANDSIETIDLHHLRLGQSLFGKRAIGVKIFGHRVEFQIAGFPDEARIQVGSAILVAIEFRRLPARTHIHMVEVRFDCARVKPTRAELSHIHAMRAVVCGHGLVDDFLDLADCRVHFRFDGVGVRCGVGCCLGNGARAAADKQKNTKEKISTDRDHGSPNLTLLCASRVNGSRAKVTRFLEGRAGVPTAPYFLRGSWGGNVHSLFSIDASFPRFSLPAMNESCSAVPLKRRSPGHPNLYSILAVIALLLVALCSARADDPDGQYLHIFDTIQQGDLMKKNGQNDAALARYREAQTNLFNFQRSYPDRDAKIISYRMAYVAARIASLSPQGAAAAASTVKPAPSKASETGSARIKLLDPGAEPRKVLRLHPKTGDKESMVITMKIGMVITAGDLPEQPVKLPTLKLAMDVSVNDISTNGDISYNIMTSDASVVEEPDIVAQVAEAMKNAAAGMKGIGGKGTLSSRGVNLSSDIKTPEGADQQVNQFVDQMKETMLHVSVPLPEEPVGAGAKWEVKMPVKSQGIGLSQTATYQLVSMDGERGTAKTTITQTAARQKIDNPMVPGSKLDLTKMTGNGRSEVTFDLARILPPEASMEFHSEMMTTMTTSNAGQRQKMEMKMDMNLHVESK